MAGIFCNQCGTQNGEGSKFCSKCGAALTVMEAAQPMQQPYQQASPMQYGMPIQQPPKAGSKKGLKITLLVLSILIVLGGVGVGLYFILSGGMQEDDFFNIGMDRVSSVGNALGEDRRLTSLKTGMNNGIETLTAVYAVSGSNQGGDIRQYLGYLCNTEGFVRRDTLADSAFSGKSGSSIQVWRNSSQAGTMLVVQADYDEKGYTITILRGQGQAGAAQSQSGGIGGNETIENTNSGNTNTNTSGSLIPTGEPRSSNTINGMKCDEYSDGTYVINDGTAVFKPDGTVYINGTARESQGTKPIPIEGTSTGLNNITIHTVNGEFYIAAYGKVLYVDANGDGSVWNGQ